MGKEMTTMNNVTVVRELVKAPPIERIETVSKFGKDVKVYVEGKKYVYIQIGHSPDALFTPTHFKEWVKALQELAEQL
jgi:hypothetical protein